MSKRPELGHQSGVHLGGIGAGRIELCRDGSFGIVNLVHSPQRLLSGFDGTFLALRAGSTFRLLQRNGRYGARGVDGLMATIRHPVGEFEYAIADLPLRVWLTAFSPNIPHNLERSTLPAAVFVLRLCNLSRQSLDIDALFSWENVLGLCGLGKAGEDLYANRSGVEIKPFLDRGLPGLMAEMPETDGEACNAWGKTVVAVEPPTGWQALCWSFWNALEDGPELCAALAAGRFDPRFDAGPMPAAIETAAMRVQNTGGWDDPDPRFGGGRVGVEGLVHPAAVLAARGELAAEEEVEIPFIVTWHAPHCLTRQDGVDHGRYCHAIHPDAVEVARDMTAHWREDLTSTTALAKQLQAGDLPIWLVDKLLNDMTSVNTNAVIPADGCLHMLEGSPSMRGALGTMDQRLVSHPGTSLFHVELNRSELRRFAELQAADGSITHFNGNARAAIGSKNVDYGVTDWPDLTMSFLIQLWRDATETGDTSFLDSLRENAYRAVDSLLTRDRDGDGVPEGGSSWDVEHYPGCFIVTASLTVATAQVVQCLARHWQDNDLLQAAVEWQGRAQATLAGMWCGKWFRKYHDPGTGRGSDDCFVGQLEGEWVARQLGLEPTVDPALAVQALHSMYERNADTDRYRLAPIQVEPDGRLSDRKYAWHAWPQYTQTFLDATALYLGLYTVPMANIAHFDRIACELIGSPTATTLWHDARTGLPDFLFWFPENYMNTPAAWWILSALSGVTDNALEQRLTAGPVLRPERSEAVWPVVAPRFWGRIRRLDCEGNIYLRVDVDRVWLGDTVTWKTLRWRGQVSQAVCNGMKLDCTPAAGGAYTDIALPATTLTAGKSLALVLAGA